MSVTYEQQCGCSAQEAGDSLVEAMVGLLSHDGRTVTARQVERSWAYGLVVLTVDSETMSVYVPMPGLCDELDEVAGRWVCERDGLLIPSVLAPCTAAATVAAWAADSLMGAAV